MTLLNGGELILEMSNVSKLIIFMNSEVEIFYTTHFANNVFSLFTT